MQVSLVTSPHLDHTIFHKGDDIGNVSQNGPLAQCFAPMGLVSLAGAAEGEAHINILDINKAINQRRLLMANDFYESAAEWLLETDPDVIGFMTEADSYHHLVRVLEKVKERSPGIITMLGGVHATAVHRESLTNFPWIDLIIRGEGETAFHDLLYTLRTQGDLKKVGNLTYRINGEIQVNFDLPLIESLDQLPYPDFSYLQLEPQDIIYLEVGRGCPFKCNFCFTAPYWERKHRIKSPDRIMAELRYFKTSYGRTDFNFTHDLLTTDRRWVLDFCKRLAATDLNVTWSCSSRTDTIDEEQIHWMKQAGCREIYFGVETGTDEMQAKINKHLDLRDARRIITHTVEAGISATTGFIAGLPEESESTLRGTLQEAFFYLGLPDTTVHLFGFSPYRGSPNFDNIKSQLILDEHFVDFPLPQDLHAENCLLMRENFDIFSRFSHCGEYKDLPLHVVRGADEFFPMVNALSALLLRINSLINDPLCILIEWIDWISGQNRKKKYSIARLYQGTISQFLEFLTNFLDKHGHLDEVTKEMIRWELIKDAIRSGSFKPIENTLRAGDSDDRLFLNPSAQIAQFCFADQFLADFKGATSKSETFVFFKREDGTSQIVNIDPMAQLVLEIAKTGVDLRAFLDYTFSDYETGPIEMSVDLEGRIEEVFERLLAMGLLMVSNKDLEFAYSNQTLQV